MKFDGPDRNVHTYYLMRLILVFHEYYDESLPSLHVKDDG